MAEVIRMPKMSDTMQQGIISRWLKRVGDPIAVGDILAEVETDKATMELESYEEGTLLYVGVPEKAAACVNEVIAVVGEPGENIETWIAASGSASAPLEHPNAAASVAALVPAEPVHPLQPSETASTLPDDLPRRIVASPLAKRCAAERGFDLAQIKGSGPAGRIVKRDVDRFVLSRRPEAEAGGGFDAVGREGHEDLPISTMRQTIAHVLTASKQVVPHFYLTAKANVNNLVTLRPQLNAHAATKISVNDCVVKAAALALAKHPKINAAWLETSIRQYHHVHVGVAVSLPEGLMVPVVRFADKKNLVAIGQEIKRLNEKAQQRKLASTDCVGATFTISNLGMLGVESFAAIINPPAACILAVGAVQQLPMVEEGKVVAAHAMHLTLSCDHRVVDGATAALFLSDLKGFLEQPLRMLL